MKIWKTTLHVSCIGKVIAEPESEIGSPDCDCIKGYKSSDWQAIMWEKCFKYMLSSQAV